MPQAVAARPVAVDTPEAFFGFRIGSDRRLAPVDAIVRYFEQVAERSPRVELVTIGQSTEGRRMIAAIVTSPQNRANLPRILEANRRLSDPRQLPPADADGLIRSHKAVVAIGASIHASEVGGTQAMNDLLYALATATDDQTMATLDNVVTILIPMLNPDGHQLVTDWYEQQKGTTFEGGPMPWLYHKYAGHDINRDAFMTNLAESRNLSSFFYGTWHPQVFLTLHQMGTNGPRFFVPPNADPIDSNYDPLIWRTAGLLGGAMSFELQREGKRGVVSSAMYDYYWPGYEDSAPLGHNTVCLLTEVASVRVATPLTVPAGDLRGNQKGLSEYRPQINFPDPWPGGSWTLRDIVDYDLTAVRGLLNAVTLYREPIVRNFYDMGRRAVATGRDGGPFAFVIPPDQRDQAAAMRLREVLLQGHIDVLRASESFRADGQTYPAGTEIVPMAQPFRAYAKTLLERQRYPAPVGRDREDRPYDVTGWTLPLQMGVDVRVVERPFDLPLSAASMRSYAATAVRGIRRPGHYLVDAPGTMVMTAAARLKKAGIPLTWTTAPHVVDGYTYQPGTLAVSASRAADALMTTLAREAGFRVEGVRGSLPTDVTPIGRGRVGIYAPWFDNISEGWTRWLLDAYGLPFTTLRDADVRAGSLRTRVDALVVPSAPADRLINGNAAGVYPATYVGGLGETGIAALAAFVREGGTLITFDQAGELATRALALPLRDVARASSEKFLCPGSLVRLNVDVAQPLAFGMAADSAAFCSSSSAWTVEDGGSSPAPRIVGRYAKSDVLLSGYLEGEEVIADRAAVVEAPVGLGRVVLFGFQPHHRGQSLATFRLLFNALLTTTGPTERELRAAGRANRSTPTR